MIREKISGDKVGETDWLVIERPLLLIILDDDSLSQNIQFVSDTSSSNLFLQKYFSLLLPK